MPSESDLKYTRKTAARSFNLAWDLLEKVRRTKKEDLMMLELAHTSLRLWSLVGSPRNRAIGQWQVSRVYSALGESKLALAFADACGKTCRESGLADLEPTADEAAARAYAVEGELRNAQRSLREAKEKLAKLRLDKEDTAVYLRQVRETEALIRARRKSPSPADT